MKAEVTSKSENKDGEKVRGNVQLTILTNAEGFSGNLNRSGLTKEQVNVYEVGDVYEVTVEKA